MFRFVALSCLLIASAFAVPAPESTSLDCLSHQSDLLSCLAVKAATTLERAARSADLTLIDGITFVRETPLERSGKSLKSETEVLNELPREATDRTYEVVSMIFESMMSFLKSHSLKINMPEGSVSRALVEGRAKIKKMFLPLIAAAGVKLLALVPIFFGGLALLVAKAVVVGKIALVFAAIFAFQRLFNGGSFAGSQLPGFAGNFFGKNPNGYYNDAQTWSSNSVSAQTGPGYYRSFSDEAQKLAYSAQAPTNTNEAH